MFEKDDPRRLGESDRRLVRRKARQLIGRAGIRQQDREDVEQDLTRRLLDGLARFEAAKAPRDAFVMFLVKRAISSLLRERRAGKRRPPKGTEPAPPVEYVLDPASEVAVRDLELAADLQSILARLPARLREIADRLAAEGSIASAARVLGRARTSLYTDVARLRRSFERAGLANYL